jgi:hypothetical protein
MSSIRNRPCQTGTSRWIIASVAAVALACSAHAQEHSEGNVPSYNTIRTPASPAFVLLGLEPSSVERPNTPADLALTVLNATSALTSLPQNFALEAAPFWLVSHPAITWRSDTGYRDPLTSMARTATISVATAQIGTTAVPVTGLSVGLRASIFSGELSDSTRARLRAAEVNLGAQSDIFNSILATKQAPVDSALWAAIRAANGDNQKIDAAVAVHKAAISSLGTAVLADPAYQAAIAKEQEKLGDLKVDREGFFLDLALGSSWQYPGNQLDSDSALRWGVWLTPSWNSESFSAIAVLRYTGDGIHAVNDEIDIGGRLLYSVSSFAISGEYVNRAYPRASGAASKYRLAGVFDYEMKKGIWVSATFGRDYGTPTGGAGLLARLGLSLNVATSRRVE